MSKELIETLASHPLRIESSMITAGSTYMLPLHSEDSGERYIDRKRRYSYFTWDEIGALTKQTDALFFLDEISPLANKASEMAVAVAGMENQRGNRVSKTGATFLLKR